MSDHTEICYLECLTDRLAKQELLPVLDLSVAFHALLGLQKQARQPRDMHEIRNYRLFAQMTSPVMLSARISGTFKPSEFIHPFEEYYSLPGYLDTIVLPCFADVVDKRAKELMEPTTTKQQKINFLAFVYMYFLLVHPFIDRNGRVVRMLLDYYNTKLNCGVNASNTWNKQLPKFSSKCNHRVAFNLFFEVACLPKRQQIDSFPISEQLRISLHRMADCLIEWAISFQDKKPEERRYHEIMVELISK